MRPTKIFSDKGSDKMNEQKIVVIPAKSREEIQQTKRLKVAAYCRVSTDEEEQETSYEAQISYYTDKIKNNANWTLAGIFADEGISGTQAKNYVFHTFRCLNLVLSFSEKMWYNCI